MARSIYCFIDLIVFNRLQLKMIKNPTNIIKYMQSTNVNKQLLLQVQKESLKR